MDSTFIFSLLGVVISGATLGWGLMRYLLKRQDETFKQIGEEVTKAKGEVNSRCLEIERRIDDLSAQAVRREDIMQHIARLESVQRETIGRLDDLMKFLMKSNMGNKP